CSEGAPWNLQVRSRRVKLAAHATDSGKGAAIMVEIKSGVALGPLAETERPFRLPDVGADTFSPEQKNAAEAVMRIAKQDHVTGPFRAYIRNAQAMEGIMALLKAGAA